MLSFGVFAQSGSFLEIAPDARSLAMGGAGIAAPANAFSTFRNAAQIPFATNRIQAAYTYAPWMRDVASGYNFHAAAAYFRIDKRQAVSAGFRRLGMSGSDGMDQYGNPTGRLKPRDMAIEGAYSRILAHNLSAAITVRYVHSDLGGGTDAGAVAFDAGVFYRDRLGSTGIWALGLQAANMGGKFDFGESKQDLPWRIGFGGAVGLELAHNHTLGLEADAGWRVKPSDIKAIDGCFGLEYTYSGIASLRGGYHAGDGSKGSNNYGSAGIGIKVWWLVIDGAYLFGDSDCLLRDTWMLSLKFTPGWLNKM